MAIILLGTIVSSHVLVSKLITKNKKTQWILDFRLGLSHYIALVTHTRHESKKEEHFEVTKSGVALMFLLNESNMEHKKLYDAISYLSLFTLQERNLNYQKELDTRLNEVNLLAKNILKKETVRY